MELHEDLSLLICSANIGNAEPTPESFAEWIPDDGAILSPTTVDSPNKGKYHIIVVGMQEAAFNTKIKKVSNPSIHVTDESGRSLETPTTEVKKKGTMQRKWEKVGLIVRGLTASQTQTPARGSSGLCHQPSTLFTEFADLTSSSQYDTSKFASLFAERCPSYSLVACNMRGEMRLWVLCLKGMEKEIGEVYVSYC
jgi:hypothetical protein